MSAERAPAIPAGFGRHVEVMVALGRRLEGHLTENEIRFSAFRANMRDPAAALYSCIIGGCSYRAGTVT